MKLFVCAEGKAGDNERIDFIKKGKYIQYICIYIDKRPVWCLIGPPYDIRSRV